MTEIDRVDLNLLRVFQAIFDERSLTLAGNRLCLSQPSISYSLRRLRVLFDDALFVRTKSGMMPTPTALELSKPISRALQAVQEALRYAESFDPAVSTRTFRISMSDMGEIVYLPPLCKILHALAPKIRLKVESLPGNEIEEALRIGRLDFAIGNLPFLMPVSQYKILFRESYVCMTAKRWGLPSVKKLSTADFLKLSHVRILSTDNSHQLVEEFCNTLSNERHIVLDVPHFSAVPEILKHTDLAVTLPRGVARWFNRAEEFAIYDPPFVIPESDITVHWHPSFEEDIGNRWLRGCIVKAIRQLSGSSSKNRALPGAKAVQP